MAKQFLLKNYTFVLQNEDVTPLTTVEVYVDSDGLFVAKAFDGFITTKEYNTMLQAEEEINKKIATIENLKAKDMRSLASAVLQNAVKGHEDGSIEIKQEIFSLLLKNSSVVKVLEP
jgi:hypothetical protein